MRDLESGDLGDDDGGVVGRVVGDGFLGQLPGDLWDRSVGMDEVPDGFFPESVHDAVSAEHEALRAFEGKATGFWSGLLVSAAEDVGQDAFAGVGTVSVFGEVATLPLVPSEVVIASQLFDPFVIDEVESGVSDVGPVEVLVTDPSESEGGAHLGGIAILGREGVEIEVALLEELGEGFGSSLVVLEMLIECDGVLADTGHEEAGGELPGIAPAHAIGHREDEVGGVEKNFAGCGKGVGGVGIDGEGEPGVVVRDMVLTFLRKGLPAGTEDVGFGKVKAGWNREDLRELEVDEAKAGELGGIGDIAGLRVIVSDPVKVFKLCEEGSSFLLGDEGGGGAAVGGDKSEGLGVVVEQAGDIGCSAVFESLQDGHFVGETLVGVGAAEALVNAALEVNVNGGSDAVFKFLHDRLWGGGRFRVGGRQAKRNSVHS